MDKDTKDSTGTTNYRQVAADLFNNRISGAVIGSVIDYHHDKYKAVKMDIPGSGCYDCDLWMICQDLNNGNFAVEQCNPDVVFKKLESPERGLDELDDYSQRSFDQLFELRTGSKFRYGDKMYEAAEIEDVNHFSCGRCCDLSDHCYNSEGYYQQSECPGHRYFCEIPVNNVCNTDNRSSKKESAMPTAEYDYFGDFDQIFQFPEGALFRWGNRYIRVLAGPGSSNCNRCAFVRTCGGVRHSACKEDRWYEVVGSIYTYAPCCGKENGLRAILNPHADGTARGSVSALTVALSVDPVNEEPCLDPQQLQGVIDNARVYCSNCGKTYGTYKQHLASFSAPATFLDDGDKLVDFFRLSKDDFLKSYSYLSEEEYDATAAAIRERTGSI